MKNTFFTILVLGMLSQASLAATIAINFTRETAPTNVTTTAFGVPATGWINQPGLPTTASIVTNGVTINWTSGNTWSATYGTAGTGENQVYKGYLDDAGTGSSVSISGLGAWLGANGATGYTIRVIQASDSATSFSNTILSVANGGAGLGSLVNPATNATAAALGGITAASNNLVSDTLYFKSTKVGTTTRATIAGFIIESTVPEASTSLLAAMGSLALLRRKR